MKKIILLIFVIFLFSCKDEKIEKSETLHGRWLFFKYENIDHQSVITYSKYQQQSIEIDTINNIIIINGSCNDGSAEILIKNSFLLLNELFLTKKYCELIENEKILINNLFGKYHISNNTLIIESNKNKLFFYGENTDLQ